MRTHALRGASAAILSIGLVATPNTSAQAAPDPTPGKLTPASMSWLASHRGELPALKALTPAKRADALRSLELTPKTLTPSAAADSITQMSSKCPAGQFESAVHSYESFEAGLPFPENNSGFTSATGAGAPHGSKWAASTLLAADPADFNIFNSNYDPVPATGQVYLSFSYRGDFATGSAAALVNDDFWDLAPSADWAVVNLNITSETSISPDGAVELGFLQLADVETAGSLDVDDVRVYSCAPPNSGLRGDWTGQGTVDLLATHSDGTLRVYEGNGNGTVQSGLIVGSGWSAFTWQGSPGDANGDGRTDLLARRSDGTLWFYAGKGLGTFASGVRVGSSWNAITMIATPGDFDLDGRPDLIGRRSDGTLHLYRILTNGAPSYLRQIGTGWNGMSSIIGMGDLNGDKRGDVVAVHANGTMISYLSSGTGLTGARTVGAGWNGMNLLTSPGDLNKDRRGDLIARRADGSLWFYAGRTGGGVISGRQVGSGWNGMSRIL